MFKKQIQITRYFVAVIAVFCFLPVAMGQSQVIKGKVTESPSGEPLPGVSVVEINANDRQVNGTVTDGSGNYALRIADSQNRIRFSYIGSKTKTEAIGTRSIINISLESGGRELVEVAITGKRIETPNTGFGTTPKRDLIGAVTSVKAEILEREPSTSIDQMLQGRAAGVQITSNSGDPGAGTDIRIRGVGSISAGSDPLYIIDGIPIISTPFDNTDAGRNVARISPIADINPSDIERIDILKDANAAAIYGSRAANGVIIITTKRGRTGVTNITFNTQFNLLQAPPAIPVLDGSAYKVMRLEGEQNNGNINPLNSAILPLVDDPSYQAYWYYQSNTNWLKELTQTGFGQVYNLSVSGGGEAVKYNFSTSYTDREGAMVNTGNQRFTGRFNLDYTVSAKLKLTANISFARTKVNAYVDYGQQTPYYNALTRSPAMPIYDMDANGNPQSSYFSLPGIMGSQDNPVAFVNTVSNNSYSTNLKPNVSAELDLIKGMKFKSNASLDFVGENGMTYLPPEATGVIWNDVNFNKIGTRDFERQQMILDNYVTYSKTLTKNEKLRGVFLLGSTLNFFHKNELRAGGYATASGQIRTLGAAAGYSELRSLPADETIISAFTKADLLYNDKYAVNVTFRRDGSSKFGPANRYANFPSVGAYWRLSAEPFLKSAQFINDLKLRAAWGQVGNQNIGNYAYISQFSAGRNYGDITGVAQSNPQLNHLRWETTETTNLGLDMELFKSRFTASVEVYDKLTKDLLYPLPLAGSSGVTPIPGRSVATLLINLGSIRNRGVELDLNLEVIKGKTAKDFNWNSSFNIGRNQNKVESLPGGTLSFTDNFARFSGQVKEGDPLGTYYGLVFKGVYAHDSDATVRDESGNIVYGLDGVTPRIMKIDSENGLEFKGGDAIYEDFNHDGIINAQDRVLVGNANADFFGGFNNSFNYKNFGLNFFVQFQYGNDIINGLRYTLEGMSGVENQAVTVLNRWRKQGDVTNMPRALRSDTRNTYGSSRWIEDGSYARLKSVTFSYKFPTDLIKRAKLRGLDLFVTGTNLFTWTNYSGADPEISLGSNPAFVGIDRGFNPQTKGATLGLNIKF